MEIFAKIVGTILVLIIGSFGLLIVAAIPPDWDYKGTTDITEKEYIELINEEDIGNKLTILEITEDKTYKIEYNFSQDGKIDILDCKLNSVTLIMVATILILGLSFLLLFTWLGIWREINFIGQVTR